MTGKFMTDPVRVLVKRDELTLEVPCPPPPPLALASRMIQCTTSTLRYERVWSANTVSVVSQRSESGEPTKTVGWCAFTPFASDSSLSTLIYRQARFDQPGKVVNRSVKRYVDLSGRRLCVVLVSASVRPACVQFLSRYLLHAGRLQCRLHAGPAGHQAVLRGGGAGGVEVRHPVRSLRHPHHHPGAAPAHAEQRRHEQPPVKLITDRVAAVIPARLMRVCAPRQGNGQAPSPASVDAINTRCTFRHSSFEQGIEASGHPCRPSSSATPSERWTG